MPEVDYEAAIVNKQNLKDLLYECYGSSLGGAQTTTYGLENEVQAFIGDFQERAAKGDDNVWIVKPTAMARSIDIWVVKNAD